MKANEIINSWNMTIQKYRPTRRRKKRKKKKREEEEKEAEGDPITEMTSQYKPGAGNTISGEAVIRS